MYYYALIRIIYIIIRFLLYIYRYFNSEHFYGDMDVLSVGVRRYTIYYMYAIDI